MMDVIFEYSIQSDHSRFSINPDGLGRLGLRTVTALRFEPPGNPIRAFEFTGGEGLVRLDPQWYQAASRFVELGFEHILDGTDHLLFLFCLVIPFRRFGALIPVVTSFTVAHSLSLIASAYNLAPDALWFPPLIEMLIAVSIVYMALENIVGGATVHRRWIISIWIRAGSRIRLFLCSSPDLAVRRSTHACVFAFFVQPMAWNWGSFWSWCC